MMAANGRTWLRATRLRHSTRRSLRATSHAVRIVALMAAPHHLAGDDVDAAGGQRSGPLELVAGDDDGGAGRRGLAQRGVELVAPGGVEPGVRLVEQPQLGPAGHQAGQRGAPLLAGRQPAHRQRARAARPARGGPSPRRSRRRWRRPWRPRSARSRPRSGRGTGRCGGRAARPAGAPRRGRRRGRSRARCRCPRASGSSPAHTRSSVVLPAPLGPRSSTISPCCDDERRAGQRREAAEHGDRAGRARRPADPSPGDATGGAVDLPAVRRLLT